MIEDYNPNHDDKGRFAKGSRLSDKPSGIVTKQDGTKTLDHKERKRYKETIVGTKTADGYEVKDFYPHLFDRAAQRNVSPNEIKNCIQKANISYPSHVGGRIVYQHEGLKVVFEVETSKIVTCMWRDEE